MVRVAERRSAVDDAIRARPAEVGAAEHVLQALRQLALPEAEQADDPAVKATAERVLALGLFRAGLMATGRVVIEVDVPHLRQAAAERAAAEAARDEAEHGAMLLARFRQIVRENPDVSASRLLASLPAEDQVPTLRKLLAATAEQAKTPRLLVAAGSQIFGVELDRPEEAELVMPPQKELGPLRRLRSTPAGTAIGGRDGFGVLRPAGSLVAIETTLPTDSSRGFSSVDALQAGEHLWLAAGHSQRGVELVQIGPQGPPLRRHRYQPDEAVQDVLMLSADVAIVACQTKVVLLHGGNEAAVVEMSGELLRLLRDILHPTGCFAVLTRGGVYQIEATNTSVQARELRPLQADAAAFADVAAVPFLNTIRLALQQRDGGVRLVGPEDEADLVYTEAMQAVDAAATPTLLAGVDEDREHVLIRKLSAEHKVLLRLFLLPQTRSRIASVAWETRSE